MRRAQRRALPVVLIVAVVVIMIARFDRVQRAFAPNPSPQRPALLLLTALPLLFGEDFSLQHNGSPTLRALEQHYRVVPVSTTAPGDLAKGRLLLMAQPNAQTAENLVALDAWVRRGGRVLLLADPLLEWPNQRALGDPLRPPVMFADTGLLGHWGLRLDTPDRRGPQHENLGGSDVLTISPGLLYGGCSISRDRLVAHCSIGEGRATIVADADLLNVDQLPGGAPNNLNGLVAELDALVQQ
jgi:hypothetical protein